MGKFVIKETKTGFVFNMVAGNGQTIAISQVYREKSSCKKGIESVRKNAPIANLEDQTAEEVIACVNPKFEVYTDKSEETRFRLKALNGEIIAVSQAYRQKANALKGIESMRKNAPDAAIEEAPADV